MAVINKPSQPLIPPTDIEDVEGIVAEAIASDDTHAPLVDDKVPAANLPSYVDDVLNFDSADEFPEEGEEGKIYVANDTNLTYRWSGAAYIQVGGASLAAGDGIDIENDIVSVDMDYVAENLDHVTDEELAAIKAELEGKSFQGVVTVSIDAETGDYTGLVPEQLGLYKLHDEEEDRDSGWIIFGETYFIACHNYDFLQGEAAEVGRSFYLIGNPYASMTNIQDAVAPKANSADVEAALSEKQDALEFNPTIPSDVTPAILSAIKDGDNYYAPNGAQWTFLTSAMTSAERIALLQTATLPYVYYNNYIFTHKDSHYGHYHFAQLRINIIGESTPTLNNLQLQQVVIDGYGNVINSQVLSGTTSLDQYNYSNQKIPSAQAVMQYVDSHLSAKQDVLTSGTNIKTINGQSVLGSGNLEIALSQSAEAKVQSMIDAAIGTALDEEY